MNSLRLKHEGENTPQNLIIIVFSGFPGQSTGQAWNSYLNLFHTPIYMNKIVLFQDKKIRAEWDAEKEEWFFSIVDVVSVLTDNDFQGARNYWKVLKHRLKNEGNESVTDCNQLKMLASDGKYYKTDVADTEQLLRLIQSIPSKKAEPFKIWLARVGRERINETEDPELAIDRAMRTYLQDTQKSGLTNA